MGWLVRCVPARRCGMRAVQRGSGASTHPLPGKVVSMPREPFRWPTGLRLLNALLPGPTLHRRVFLTAFLCLVASMIFGILSWQDDFAEYDATSALVLLCLVLFCFPLPILGFLSLRRSQTEDRPAHARPFADRAPPCPQSI